MHKSRNSPIFLKKYMHVLSISSPKLNSLQENFTFVNTLLASHEEMSNAQKEMEKLL